MRVAFVTTEMPPAVEGGAGTYAAHLGDALSRNRVDLVIFCPKEAANAHANASYQVVGVASHGAGLLGFWWHLPGAFRRSSRADPYDVVHGNGIAALPLAVWSRTVAHVTTIHHVTRELLTPGIGGVVKRLSDLRGETGVVPYAEQLLAQKSDRLIAVSRYTSEQLSRHYPQAQSKTVVLHSGVAPMDLRRVGTDGVAAIRRRFCPSDEALLLAVGRLEHRKGMDLLIRAFAALNNAKQPAKLLIVGGGRTDRLKALADRLECASRVHFVDRLTSPDLAAAYHACDVFIMPSRHEGFGFVAFEAMAAGKPVVVSRTGAAIDGLIDSSCGAVVEIGDVGAMEVAIGELLADPGRAVSIGLANQARVARLSWETTARATTATYEQAVQAASIRRSW